MAHFVAMIPFVSDSTAFAGSCDLWATSEVRCVKNAVTSHSLGSRYCAIASCLVCSGGVIIDTWHPSSSL